MKTIIRLILLAVLLTVAPISVKTAFAQKTGVTITTPPSPTGPFTATITFSTSITGFSYDDITGTNCTISNGNGDNTIFTVLVTPTSNGTITLSIAEDVVDGGNEDATLSIDFNTTPSLSAVTIKSNNENSNLAKPNDIVTLQFTASEEIGSPTVTIANNSIIATNTTGNTWKADYTTTNTTPEGVILFSINFADLGGNNGTEVTATTDGNNVTFDQTAPSGYSVGIDQEYINSSNKNALSFTISNAEANAKYVYGITSSGGGTPISVTTPVAVPADGKISNIDVSGLADGTLTLSVTLTDAEGNTGAAVTDNDAIKDVVAPTGYSVNIDQAYINSSNKNALSFTFGSAEINTNYIYTINSNNGGTTITGNGSITTANQQVTGIDVTDLTDGTLTLSVTLTDAAENTGTAATVTVTKDVVAPSDYSVAIGQANINNSNKDAFSFTFSGAETNTNYSYSISSSGGGTPITGNGSITAANQNIPNINVSSLNDGTLTLSVTLGDAAGNTKNATSNPTVSKDVVAPSGYSVDIDQEYINSSNKNALSFTFSGAETSTTYNYSISSNGGGTPITGNGSITAASQSISNINVSSLKDGTLTLSVTLTDAAGNAGTTATATVTKDVVAPSGYSVDIDQEYINNSNKNALSFTFASAEIGTNYSYSISNNGGTPITGNGSITAANQNISNINVSSLNDGTLTLSVTLSDAAGNETNALDYVDKDTQTQAPTLTKPATEGSSAREVDVDFTLPEAATVGTVKITIDNASDDRDPIVLTLAASCATAGQHTFKIDGEELNQTYNSNNNNPNISGVSGSNAILDDILYTVTLEYQDQYGNPVSQVANTNFYYSWSVLTADISQVETPRNTAINEFTIEFSKRVKNVDVNDFTLKKGGEIVTVSGINIASSDCNNNGKCKKYTLTNFSGYTANEGSYSFSLDTSETGIYSGQDNNRTYLYYGSSTYTTEWEVDKTTPQLYAVTATSNNIYSSSVVNKGGIVKVSVTGSENIEIKNTSTIAGITVDSVSGSGRNWSMYLTIPNNYSGANNSIIPFEVDLTDDAGNETSITAITHGSNVTFNNSVPTLSNIEFVSSNSNNTLAKVGDVLTLRFTSSETLQTVNATINGKAVSATNTSGNNWEASYSIASTDTEGTIPFTINFMNSVGTYGTQVTNVTEDKTINFDKTTPTLSNVSLGTENTTTPIGLNANVNLQFIVSEEIDNLVVTINGNTIEAANISLSGSTYNASYTTTDTDDEGIIPFTINFTDKAGNQGVQVSQTTNGSKLNFDKTAPSLISVSIASNNSNNTLAKVGNTATLLFSSNEKIKNVSVTINNNTITGVNLSTTDNINWTATYTPDEDDNEGTIPFTISFEDLAGNAGTDVSATTNNSSVTFDRTAPTANSVIFASSNTNNSQFARFGDVVTLTFATSEAATGVQVSINSKTITATSTNNIDWTAIYSPASSDAEGTIPYTINYTDLAGNAGTEESGTAVTYDKTSPSLNSVEISCSNGTALSKLGDVITLTFVATNNEEIDNVAVTINGNSATTTSIDNINWTATHTLTNTDAEGTIPFVISYSDKAGNYGTAATTTTNSSSILYDRTTPVLTSVLISSNNSNNTLAKVADEVTLQIKASEAVKNVVVIMNGNSITGDNLTTTDNINWTATYTPDADDNEGTIPFTISFEDLAGNAGVAVNATTNGSSVTFDKTAPTANSVNFASSNTNNSQFARFGDMITLTFTTSEAATGVQVSINSKTITATSPNNTNWTAIYTPANDDNQGAIPYTINYTDLAGNAGIEVSGTTVTYDRTNPSLNTVEISCSNNTSLAVLGNEITLTFKSDNNETLDNVTVTINGNSITATSADNINWTATHTLTNTDAEGTIPFTINYSDYAGNYGSVVTATTNSSSIYYDRTTPVLTSVTISSDNSKNSSLAKLGDIVTLQFKASEAVENVAVIMNSNSITGANITTTDNINWTATYTPDANDDEGIIPFTISFEDLAGNAGVAVNATTNGSSVTFDRTTPTANSVIFASSNTNNSQFARFGDMITLTFTTSEAATGVQVSINSQTITATSPNNTNWTAVYTPANDDNQGAIPYTINYTDLAGNAGTEVSGTTVTYDRTNPSLNTVEISCSNNTSLAVLGNEITLTFKSDNNETLDNVTVTINGNSITATSADNINWTATHTLTNTDAEGTIPFTINYSDYAGNYGSVVTTTTNSSSIYYDRTTPVLTSVTISSDNSKNSSLAKLGDIVTLQFSASEIIENVAVIMNGNSITGANLTTTDNINWTATYEPQISHNQGTISFSIDFTDNNDNAGTQVNAITFGNDVSFDGIKPTISNIQFTTDNANSSYARLGNSISLSFTSSEAVDNARAVINGKSLAATSSNSTDWLVTYAPSSTDTEGLISYTITFSDIAGNEGDDVTSISTINFDRTQPLLSDVSVVSNNTIEHLSKSGDEITLSFTSNETINTPQVLINGISATSVTETTSNHWIAKRVIGNENSGVLTFSITVEDLAGNSPFPTTTASTSVTIDNNTPSISSVTVRSGLYKVGDEINIIIYADDKTYSGSLVSANGKTLTLINNNNNTYSINYVVAEGDNPISRYTQLPITATLVDSAGNTCTPIIAADVFGGNGQITIDASTPVINSITSNANSNGILGIGDSIYFVISLAQAEPYLDITPKTYNGSNLNWSTANNGFTYTSKYFVKDGDTDQKTPLQLGTVVVTDTVGNTDNQDYNAILKSIFGTRPTAQISGTQTKCYDGEDELITIQFTGTKPFSMNYLVDGVAQTKSNINANSEAISITQGTITLVSVTDSTTNTFTATTNNTASVTVVDLPVVSFDVTLSPYSPEFSGGDELSQYVPETDKRTGVFVGAGVAADAYGSYYFYPSLIAEENRDNDIPISYTYTDPNTGCSATVTDNVMVSSSSVSFQLSKNIFCYYEDSVSIVGALPDDCYGLFNVTTADDQAITDGWSSSDGRVLMISPRILGTGSFKITYTAYSSATNLEYLSVSKTFSVEDKVGTYEIDGLDNAYCFDNATSEEVSISIFGLNQTIGDEGHYWTDNAGVFTIVDGTHTARFKRANATANTDYTIYYCYESVNGCYSDTVSKTIHINPLPEIEFALQSNYNFDSDAIELVASPSGGSFSASAGISVDGSTYNFSPNQITNLGTPFSITYSYTNPETQCSNTSSASTIVYKASETISNLNSLYCYSNSTFNISCQSAHESQSGTFSSTRGAVTNTGANVANYNLATVGGNQTDTVTYTYQIDQTNYHVSTIVTVDSIGTVSFSENIVTDSVLCKDDADITIRVEIGHKNGSGVFTWNGPQSAITESENRVVISPTSSEMTQGMYNLSYTYTSNVYNQCHKTIDQNIYVYNIPSTTFESDFPSYFAIDADTINLLDHVSPTINGTFAFTGANVLFDSLLVPSVAGTGNHTLTYTFTDLHGCTNSATRSFGIIGADVAFKNCPTSVCVYESPVTLTAVPNNGTNGSFSGVGITNINDTTALFDPSVAGYLLGGHTITYNYTSTFDNTTVLHSSIKIDVVDLGSLTINLTDNYELCYNDNFQQLNVYNNSTELLSTQVDFSGSSTGVQGPTNDHYYFSPSAVSSIGRQQIKYSFTKDGCTIDDSVTVIVKPIPDPHFTILEKCIDFNTTPISFINTTDTTSIEGPWQWQWTLKDGISSIASTDFQTQNQYSSSGTKQVILTAVANGCSNSIDSTITVEYMPSASFSWVNECENAAIPTIFRADSNQLITSYNWIFDNESMITSGSNASISHSLTEGLHQIRHIIEINDGECFDTLMREIFIQPTINVAQLPNGEFFEDFENSNGSWISRSVEDGEYSSWNYGLSEYFTSDSTSTEKSWYTKIDYPTQNEETSELVSPCFDFTSLENPMIKLNIWSWAEAGRDGAVLHYSFDQGQTWTILGAIDDGINWFNSASIRCLPSYGWSGEAMTDWESARLNIDVLKNKPNVRFRIYYSADANAISEFHGFALNEFWLGSKRQNALFEYFTNNTLGDNLSYYNDVHQTDESNTGYFTPIYYHTDYPSGDALCDYYSSGPISRMFYYGVTSAPYAISNGSLQYDFSSSSDHSNRLLNIIDKQSLYDPKVDVNVNISGDANGCTVNASVTSLEDLSGENLALFCAIVKDSIEIDGEMYYHVLRDFIPDAGGTILSGNLSENQTQTTTLTWKPRSSNDIVDGTLVAFVQNIETNEIYQTTSIKLSSVNNVENTTINNLVTVYPNPASSSVMVKCDFTITDLSIIDATGKTVMQIPAGSIQTTVDIQNLPAGIYLIKGTTSNGNFVKKLVKH